MIEPGYRCDAYEILGHLGAGGMGEVYRARDPRLGRDVAIKVLVDAFARDAARAARFQREAQLLAALSHPNISAIYGLEQRVGKSRAANPYIASTEHIASTERRPSRVVLHRV